MKRWLTTVFCSVFVATLAFADGDGPTRTMNSSEAAAFNTLQRTIKSALPQPPPSYTVTYTGFDLKEVPEAISSDKMAWMSFMARYTLNPAAVEARQHAALMDSIKGTPEQQARRSALSARSEQLKKARKSTRDPAEKERIRAELKKVNDEDNALTNEIATSGQKSFQGGGADTGRQGSEPKQLTMRLLVNQDVHIQNIAQPYPLSGAPRAFAQNDRCQDAGTYCITVLLGAFTPEKRVSGSTRYNLRNAKLGVPTKARGMALIISSPKNQPEYAQNLLKKTDLRQLKSLLP